MRCLVTMLLVVPFVVGLAGTSRGAEGDGSEKPLVLTAERLATAYRADEVAANRQYKDKAVLLYGVVASMTRRREAGAILRLKGGPGQDLSTLEVACLFED